MFLDKAFNQSEIVTQFLLHRLRAISNHLQTAAPKRTAQRKSSHNQMASELKRVTGLVNISAPSLSIYKEMEDSTIVPHIKRTGRKGCLRNICLNPRNLTCGFIQTR